MRKLGKPQKKRITLKPSKLYDAFTGIDQLGEDTFDVMRRYGIVRAMRSFVFSLTGTFFALHIIDHLGYASAGVAIAIMLFTQLVIDYPSGSLGDYIGQKWILTLSFTSFAIGYYFFALAQTFNSFVIVAIVLGFAAAQGSGALQSWLDNNYSKLKDGSDTENKNYGYTMTRFSTIDTFIVGFTILLGGNLAATYSRSFVFQLQSLIIIVLIFMVLILINDVKNGYKADAKNKPKYFTFLKGGISFVFSSKAIFLLIMGMTINQVTWILWGNLMLFPIYFGYTGSDYMAGLLRSIIFFLGVVIQIFVAKYTKKINNDKLVPLGYWQVSFLFIGIIVLLVTLPMTNSFNLLGFILLILLMTLSVSTLMPFIGAIFQRVLLDVVPSKNRNAIYSLFPSISGAICIPLLPFTGAIIENFGMHMGVLISFGVALISLTMILMGQYLLNPTIRLPYIIKKLIPSKTAVSG